MAAEFDHPPPKGWGGGAEAEAEDVWGGEGGEGGGVGEMFKGQVAAAHMDKTVLLLHARPPPPPARPPPTTPPPRSSTAALGDSFATTILTPRMPRSYAGD